MVNSTFLALAVVASYPSFIEGYFKLTMDGQIHLIKFEAIADSFRELKLPPLVNFMGYGNIGMAFTGMYPWIAGMIFIIPRMLLSNPIHALFVGYFLLNLLTIVNTYALAQQITKNYYWRLLGVLIYEFNTYHLTVMYGRNAMGEMLAYTFLPIVFMGCIQIWNKQPKGFIALGVGMGMVLNSHVISVAVTCILLAVVELVRIITRRFSLKELKLFIYAAIVATLVSLYTLVNMLSLMLKNNLVTPWKGMVVIVPSKMWQAMLDNNISDNTAENWNIGIITFIIFIGLVVQLFRSKSGPWRGWIIAALAVEVLTFSWIPFSPSISTSFIGNIQFLGRLYSFIVLFIVIGALFYNKEKL